MAVGRLSDGTPVGGSSSVARRAVRRAAVDMSTATTTAACTRARAARAHHTLKLGPRIYGPRRCLYLCPGGLCFPDPTSAGGSFPPSRAGGFLRRERPVVEERRRARAACDLEGNRAGLGCLEHLGNALSFAVVTEWPVRVYPRRRRWSPPGIILTGSRLLRTAPRAAQSPPPITIQLCSDEHRSPRLQLYSVLAG